jgi:hypothetical protein
VRKETMPAKKNIKKKKSTDVTMNQALQVEVPLAETSQPEDRYGSALVKADAVLATGVGTSSGTISEQRARHYSGWDELLREDQTTRSQILELKSKENQVLGLIRDRVAENLIETIDKATEQGILKAPEEV